MHMIFGDTFPAIHPSLFCHIIHLVFGYDRGFFNSHVTADYFTLFLNYQQTVVIHSYYTSSFISSSRPRSSNESSKFAEKAQWRPYYTQRFGAPARQANTGLLPFLYFPLLLSTTQEWVSLYEPLIHPYFSSPSSLLFI